MRMPGYDTHGPQCPPADPPHASAFDDHPCLDLECRGSLHSLEDEETLVCDVCEDEYSVYDVIAHATNRW